MNRAQTRDEAGTGRTGPEMAGVSLRGVRDGTVGLSERAQSNWQ